MGKKMKMIQYSVWKKETNNAGGKAKNDAYDIAEKLGFEASYHPVDKRVIRVIQQYASMRKFDSADVVLMQYPAVDFRILPNFLKHIDSAKTTIALIHDLRSIQGSGAEEDVAEIPILNHFKYVIAHNKHMERFLMQKGYMGQVINLEMFDYLHDDKESVQEPKGDGAIAFAGNLGKSRFINELASVNGVKFLLYGNRGKEEIPQSEYVNYKGSLPSDEIVYKLEGDFGLVWDGDSIKTCSGKQGEYLRFNNPHKMSLYIAAGKPIITWKHAAVADFVKQHNIGIVVDDLTELESLDLSNDYQLMRNNVLGLKKQIASGEFFAKALRKALDNDSIL